MTTTKKKQGAIYGRKSRENEATLENQINACIEWAENNDIEYEVFAEEGTQSSEEWNRPELQKMLKKIEKTEFHFVIVSEQTRISRNEDYGIFRKLMRETGTILVLADTNQSINYLNPTDAVVSGVQQAFGELELSMAKTRLKRGTVQSAKKGNWVAKKAPLGYVYNHDTKRLKQNEDAPVIREMFDMYLAGMSTVEITHQFNTPPKKLAYHKVKGEMVPVNWSSSTVSRMLNNIAYVGHTVYGKTTVQKIQGKRTQIEVPEEEQIIVKDTHKDERIITEEEWNKVQTIMSKKRNLPPALKHSKHTFSGLVKCAKCGAVHTFEKATSKTGKFRISSCKTRHYDDDFIKYKMCGNSGGELDSLEVLFYATLRETRREIDNYIYLIKEIQASGAKAGKSLETQKNVKLQQIEQMKKKRKNIQGFLEDGDYYEGEEKIEKIREVKQLANRIKSFMEEIGELEKKKGDSELQHVKRVITQIDTFFEGVKNSASGKVLNEILNEFISKIVYRRNGRGSEVEIEVYLKDEIQEIINHKEELSKIA
jgi:DNA invertase Pin-like site-specific DNA recombinase